ncbi:glycosyl transferase [Dispira parvispora]|uniref:Alpha-1,3-glucosyltransferase n=1 Tax=Dispira parvispora TaxID=1520584 RepID=A0A9W8AV21_9FUNG|nr:glycosyl transferase [Dispira parvispora]
MARKPSLRVTNGQFIRDVFWFSTFTKLLLFSAYKSTDFEVHRNWLAITHQLPVAQWYRESTSQWTLDYPPFFAWFEWVLSWFATWFDSGMLVLQATPYESPACTFYQRLTVLVTEQCLLYALVRYTWGRKVFRDTHMGRVITLLTFLNPGFYLVDHIHFQYNAAMYGLLVLSIALMSEQRPLWAGMVFSVLLNFKHIYAYVAPAYFVYLLSGYCLGRDPVLALRKRTPSPWLETGWRLAKLGSLVSLVFAVSLGPFLYTNQLSQLITRLFPFKRGLCHALWAPNFWALYSVGDRLLYHIVRSLGIWAQVKPTASMTRGIVGDVVFAVLPDISPRATFILTVLVQLPGLVYLFRYPSRTNFIKCIVLSGFASFLFGWHVHEKAYLLIVVPMALLLTSGDINLGRIFFLLNLAGVYGLFPLLHQPMETPLKLSITLLWVFGARYGLKLDSSPASPTAESSGSSCNTNWSWVVEGWYMWGFICLQAYLGIIHSWVLGDNPSFEFLPILLTACYSAVGMVYVWVRFYIWFFLS